MGYTVGPKGQVVIPKAYRDRLGAKPGWMALSRLVDDHIEVRFLPPEHTESLAGSLAPHIKRRPPAGMSWHEIRKAAWAAEARRRVKDWKRRGR